MVQRRLSSLFGKGKNRGKRSRNLRRGRTSVARLPESLERRIALTVSHQVGVGPFLTGVNTWATIYSDGGDDVYTSVVTPASVGQTAATPALIYADNASFLGYTPILPATYAAINDVLVTNGTTVLNTNEWTLGGQLVGAPVQATDGYPIVRGTTSAFVLATEEVDLQEPVFGIIDNGVGGRWSFTNGGAGNVFAFTAVTVPVGPQPLTAVVRGRNVGLSNSGGPSDAVFEVEWDTNLVGAGGFDVTVPPSIDITYDSDDAGGVLRLTSIQSVASSAATTTMTLPVPAGIPAQPQGYQIVPGTLQGTIVIERGPGSTVSFPFTTNGQYSNTLAFDLVLQGGLQYDDEGVFRTTGQFGGDLRYVRGRIGVGVDENGVAVPTLVFTFEGQDGTVRFAQEVGRVSVVASYAIYNQPVAFQGGNYTHYDGLDFTKSLTVDLLAPGATTTVESYIDGTYVDFHSSNVIVNAPTRVLQSFTVSNSRAGSAVAEQVFVNANTAAATYDIRVSDDPGTSAIQRSKVFVSTTGSLGRTLPTGINTIPLPASSAHVEVGYGDVIIEGLVVANDQTYIVNSAAEFEGPDDSYGVNHRGPYYVTTRAPISGANTGRLVGQNVGILLGNDVPTMYDDVANGGAHSFNVVDIRTDVNSIRVQAADRKLNPIQTPFPYDLTVEELNSFRIDAVAASSRPIVLTAANDIAFHASVESASDFTVNAIDGDLWMNAPLSTRFGTIRLEANQLTIGNSVRVLDTYYDDQITDISLLARNGDLQLTGPISAVNGIEIRQDQGNRVFGDARIIADRLTVDATGSVTVRTDVREMTGRVSGQIAIDELTDINVVGLECADGRVSITAAGRDLPGPTDDEGNTTTVSALRATLPDASVLTVSAPNGSIDVRVSSSTSLSLGDPATIVRRTATPMVASGRVFIESEAASIDAYDAPVGGSNAFIVRAATAANENLDGTYAQRSPGTFPSTLTGKSAGRLVVDGVADLRVRDVILVKDQGNPNENGIYQIVDVGSSSRPWVLARHSSYDTTAELSRFSRFKVSEGNSNAETVFVLSEYVNYVGETPKRVGTILNRSRAFSDSAYLRADAAADGGSAPQHLAATERPPFAVRAVSTTELSAYHEYDPTSKKSFITSVVDEPIPLFDGVAVTEGDVVLVRLGTRDPSGAFTEVSNGVYVVVSAGSTVATWTLQSVEAEEFDTGLVVAMEGSLRTAVTGNVFQVAYNSLGVAEASFDADLNGTTEIGSRDINDVVRFVVSSNGGTNNGTGTLGKMISLSNVNSYMVPVDGGFDDTDLEDPVPQRQAVAFGASIGGAINLTQALPAITRKVVIDATATRLPLGGAAAVSQIVVSGTRVTTLANGTLATSLTPINGFTVTGEDADGTVIRGIRMGGFGSGAAVQINAADGVLIDSMELGLDRLGRRSAVKYGVEAINGAGGYSTISNSLIHSGTAAGVIARGSGESIRLVGNTIGARGFENAIGVDFVSGTNFLGLVTQTTLLRRVSATRINPTRFSLPGTYSSLSAMYVGLGVGGERIQPDDGKASARIKSITEVMKADGTGVDRVMFEIEDGVITLPALDEASPVLLDFGAYVGMEAGNPEVTFPTGVFESELYLGQPITGAGLPAGTTITEIDLAGRTITLSNAPNQTGIIPVGMTAVPRNVVAYNSRGVVLRNGENRVVNTDVSNSVFDGIRLAPGNDSSTAKFMIGGGDGRIGVGGRPSSKDITAASNAIFSNGSAGIRIGATVTAGQVQITGNRLGVTSSGVAGRNVGGNIVGLGIGSGTEPTALGTLVSTVPHPNRPGALIATLVMPNHGLKTGDVVWLDGMPFTLPAGVNPAFECTRLGANRFAITLPAGTTNVLPNVTDSVRIHRYGSLSPRARAIALASTLQRDFEGNLHAPAGPTSDGRPSGGRGGVIARPVIPAKRN